MTNSARSVILFLGVIATYILVLGGADVREVVAGSKTGDAGFLAIITGVIAFCIGASGWLFSMKSLCGLDFDLWQNEPDIEPALTAVASMLGAAFLFGLFVSPAVVASGNPLTWRSSWLILLVFAFVPYALVILQMSAGGTDKESTATSDDVVRLQDRRK